MHLQLAALRLALRPRSALAQAALDSSALLPLQYRLLSWTRRALGRTGAADFDADLRPVLMDGGVTERTLASDPPAWCTNQFFMVWLRREFLSSRYALDSAAAAAALSARIDEHPLLTRAEAEALFEFPPSGGTDGAVSSGADDERAREEIVARRTTAGQSAALLAGDGAESAAPPMPMGDLLDVAGACVGGRGSFNLFCEERQIFEFLTREYVDALADRIAARARELVERGVVAQSPVKVLEVGAGSGRLAEAVAAALHERAPLLCDVIATDTGDWRLFGGARVGVVRVSANPHFKISAGGAPEAGEAVDGAAEALVRYVYFMLRHISSESCSQFTRDRRLGKVFPRHIKRNGEAAQPGDRALRVDAARCGLDRGVAEVRRSPRVHSDWRNPRQRRRDERHCG